MLHVPDLRAAAAWILDQYTLSRSRSLSWELTEDDVFSSRALELFQPLPKRPETRPPHPLPLPSCARGVRTYNGSGAGHQFTLLPRPSLVTRLSRLLYN